MKEGRLVSKGLEANTRSAKERTYAADKHIFAAFAASHPQVSTVNQEILIALARYTFLLELKAQTEFLEDGNSVDFSWVQLEKVCTSAPSEFALRSWVLDQVIDQLIIYSPLVKKKMYSFNLMVGTMGKRLN